jgi:cytoskeletal protein CcmA (bactofilin family)
MCDSLASHGYDRQDRRLTNGYSPRQDDTPETTIGKQVKMKGELAFDKLLRVDGAFEGRLVSKVLPPLCPLLRATGVYLSHTHALVHTLTLIRQGDLVIGKSGSVTGDIENMGILVNEGKIIGNVVVERLELRGKVCVCMCVCVCV